MGMLSAQALVLLKEDNVRSHVHDAVREPTASGSGRMTTANTAPLTSKALLDEIITSLEDDKAEDIVKIDLHGKSEMADYMVVASGRSSRQVSAIANHLVDSLKQNHGRLSKIEGKETGDWVLVDVGDVIVHVFRPEVREFYQLEKMWLTPGGPGSMPA